MRLIRHIHDSIISPLHDKNEDKILVIENNKYCLFFLFDGVGSAINAIRAVETAANYISKNYQSFDQGDKFQLSKLMYNTHLELEKTKLPEILCTYVAMFIPRQDNKEASVSSMGDSRIYGVSEQYITRYTIDDSVPGSDNAITKCLGMIKLKEIDFSQNNFLPKEKGYLLSSDGFYKLMERDFKNKQSFYNALNFSSLVNTQKAILKKVTGNNEDDASYILIKIHV